MTCLLSNKIGQNSHTESILVHVFIMTVLGISYTVHLFHVPQIKI